MKKGIIVFAALGLLAIVSCSKDRTCSCTTDTTGLITSSTTVDTTLVDMTKGDAKASCDALESSGDVFGIQWTTACELK